MVDTKVDRNGIDPMSITRPTPRLMVYYFVSSLILGPLFFIALIPLMFRYRTMRFTFDDDGITLKYGAFFQNEKRLNYRRIQDIHVTRGLLQRWFGLANIALFTASGSAGAEITLEGIPDPEAFRDFLYLRSRRAREGRTAPAEASETSGDEALELLREIRDAVKAIGSGSS